MSLWTALERAGIRKQHLKFLASGGVTFLFETVAFALAFRFTGSLVGANAVAVGAAAVVNYALHYIWVFDTQHGVRVTATRYLATLGGSYMINTALVVVAVWAGAAEVAAKVGAGLFMAPLAFIVGRYWVYPEG